VELKDVTAPDRAASERLHYARVLGAGTRIGLAVLAAGFLVYVLEGLAARVPLTELPAIWTMPASDYLHSTGMPGGWGWLALLNRGDVLPLMGIAILAAVPFVSLIALVPIYAARRDWIYLFIAVLQVAVLALAASGVLVSFH
jgi:hypothetical protein